MFGSTTIPLLEEVANFAQARHGVLVGNVANLDTPGYRTRDLSVDVFQERLKEALEARRVREEGWSSSGIVTRDPNDSLRDVGESLNSILYHDDSNVGLEQQILQISKNQYLHNLAISIMSNQFRLLQAAISERV
jgi:flagellar basal-body rod protein FlgB